MSQIFLENGMAVPVTLIKVLPNVVLRVKTEEKDGYAAAQVGIGEKKAKNIKKPQKGLYKELGNFKYVREIRGESEGLERSSKIDSGIFQEGDMVRVSGITKSKGFQGVVKRHGFHGAPKTHGTKHAHRQPGSIGATWPQRVIKGKRMAGRMGGERVTVRNLKIVKVDAENNLLAIKGAVPGRRGTLVEIKG